jgi:cyclopropane-fatty-acyl-phospholipid synthase
MLMHLAWSRKQARYNAEYHYGLHPEFYFNYLGPTGMYSTGFWYENTKTVEEAQDNKWDLIFKKLLLHKPGLRICSVGSGFGYGEMLLAEKYGAIVDCYNTCRPQNKWLREEVKRRGLEGKVNVFDADYRDLGDKENVYDRFLAIECVEHAQNLFRKGAIKTWAKCLKDDGVGVIQWLSYDIDSDVSLFIRKYLYPGVTMPPLGSLTDEIVYAGCEVLDLLCNRRHYYYTLNAWTDNFIKNWDIIRAIDPKFYTEAFRRKWLLYLSSGAFYLTTPDATARLYQLTFSKGDTDTYPMNREFLYDKASDAAWVLPHQWVIREDAIVPSPGACPTFCRLKCRAETPFGSTSPRRCCSFFSLPAPILTLRILPSRSRR